MSLTTSAEQVPLTADSHGVVRVMGTRIPIEMVVDEFNQGASPEEIVLSYPTLELSQAYSVIAYYLRNKTEVDAYIKGQDRLAHEAREWHGVNAFSRQLREQLIQRKKKP